MIAEYCLYPDDCNDTTTCEFCLIGEITTLTAQLEAATTALEILDENSYCHHTPHMICVPTEHWKRAMNTTTGE